MCAVLMILVCVCSERIQRVCVSSVLKELKKERKKERNMQQRKNSPCAVSDTKGEERHTQKQQKKKQRKSAVVNERERERERERAHYLH